MSSCGSQGWYARGGRVRCEVRLGSGSSILLGRSFYEGERVVVVESIGGLGGSRNESVG